MHDVVVHELEKHWAESQVEEQCFNDQKRMHENRCRQML